MSDTPTPRTDAHIEHALKCRLNVATEASWLARRFERELADARNHEYAGEIKAAQDEIATLRNVIERLRDALQLIAYDPGNPPLDAAAVADEALAATLAPVGTHNTLGSEHARLKSRGDHWQAVADTAENDNERLRAENDRMKIAIRAVCEMPHLLDPQCAADQALVDRLKKCSE